MKKQMNQLLRYNLQFFAADDGKELAECDMMMMVTTTKTMMTRVIKILITKAKSRISKTYTKRNR